MRCLSTPISSRAAVIAAVAAFCAFSASNSRLRESRSANSLRRPASAASSSAAAARAVVSASDSFCAATARKRAFSSAHFRARSSPAAISASSAASALSARRMAFCTTRSTSRRALSNHAPRLSSSSSRIESAWARASRSSVSLSFSRIKNTMLSAVSFATASLCRALADSALSARSSAAAAFSRAARAALTSDASSSADRSRAERSPIRAFAASSASPSCFAVICACEVIRAREAGFERAAVSSAAPAADRARRATPVSSRRARNDCLPTETRVAVARWRISSNADRASRDSPRAVRIFAAARVARFSRVASETSEREPKATPPPEPAPCSTVAPSASPPTPRGRFSGLLLPPRRGGTGCGAVSGNVWNGGGLRGGCVFDFAGDARAFAPKRPASSGRSAAMPCSRSATHDAMVFFGDCAVFIAASR